MEKIKSESLDWALWFYWIMATTLGWLIGNMFFKGIPVIISGVVIAGLQWSVLHKRIQKAWRWLILSSIGWIIGYIIAAFIPNLNFLVGPVIGGAIGILQWFILRKEVDFAGWWVVISILAWTTGLTIMPGALTSGSLPGALTGLVLVILFRFSSDDNQNGLEEK